MARFDLYISDTVSGLLLDVQSDLLSDLNTRIVIPLMPLTVAPRPARILNPIFDLAEAPHVLVTQFMSAVPLAILRQSCGSLADQSEHVTRAIDFLHQGF